MEMIVEVVKKYMTTEEIELQLKEIRLEYLVRFDSCGDITFLPL